MSPLRLSDSQETLLPMHIQAAEPRRTFTMWTGPLAAMFPHPQAQAANAAEYEHLACASEEDLLKPSSPTLGIRDEHAPATAQEAVLGAVWYLRMLLLLTLICTGTTLVSSLLALFLGSLVVLGRLEPFNTVSGAALYTASAAGAGVLGAAIGALAFLVLVARRLRMSRAQRAAMDAAAENPRAGASEDQEPVELQTALFVAVAAGAFAMAAGMGVCPGLVPADAPFKVGHAVALGVWGLFVPAAPYAVGALVSTLWSCDPEAGVEAGAECVDACCSSR